MYNPLAKRIGNVMDEAVAKNKKRTAPPPQKPVPKAEFGPSKDPAIRAEIARRMAAQEAAENVVPKITRKK